MTNHVVMQMAKALKKASAENNAPLWSKLAELAHKPSSARSVINLKRINQLTKDDDAVIFPGKVLGSGTISHKITLFSFSISNSAVSKIKQSGGNIVGFSEMIKKSPSGKGMNLLG